MPDPHPPLEPSDGLGIEHVPDHPVVFHLIESTAGSAGDDAGGILASVLQERKGFDATGVKT
jgi:hypothetical protein